MRRESSEELPMLVSLGDLLSILGDLPVLIDSTISTSSISVFLYYFLQAISITEIYK